MTSSLCPESRSRTINRSNMASFMAVDGECATVFQNSPLLYVYCVSNDFPVRPLGLPCIDLVCRQLHTSFVDKMAERRISLVPLKNSRVQVEDVFTTACSPVLIERPQKKTSSWNFVKIEHCQNNSKFCM